MKRILLFTLVLAVMTMNLKAQNMSWNHDTTKASTTSNNGFNDFYAEALLTNTGYDFDSFVWIRTNVVKPANWTSAVCDVNLCYDTLVDSAHFVLEKGETGYFALHFYTNSNAGGNASMDVTVYNTKDRGNPAKLTAMVYTWATSTKEITSANVAVYPNPTTGKLNIELPKSVSGVINMDVINVVGQNVKSFQFTGNGTYDLSALDAGIYFLKFKVNGKQVVKKFQITD